MRILKKEEDLMLELSPEFQRKLFTGLIKKYGRHFLSGKLKKAESILYHYKNNRVKAIPKIVLEKAGKLSQYSKKELQANILSSYSKEEKDTEILNKGRERRRVQLKQWKKEIPSLNKIFVNNYLDFEKWFLAYQKLINFGARKFNYIKKENKILKISYITHSNNLKKEFILKFPRKILVNREFIYFFGLWVGDKAGGGRLGIMNKEQEIINFTKNYLKKLYQNPETILYIAENKALPHDRNFDGIVRIKHKRKGYAFSTHTINGILVSFFNYLESNLNEFLFKIKKYNAFFAGLFDAEGNVFLEDSCFRWSCLNEKLKEIFQIHLKRLNLFKRYDGVNFVSYNKKIFSQKILPHIIHPKKINNSNLVCFGKGKLEKRFKEILKIVESNPGITNRELAKALKKVKSYAQVRVLERLGYIQSKNYPKQLFINKSNLEK